MMALYDDKCWLLSHIRHSFIHCDDTGNAEQVFHNNENQLVREAAVKEAEQRGTRDFSLALTDLDGDADHEGGGRGEARSFEIRIGRHQVEKAARRVN